MARVIYAVDVGSTRRRAKQKCNFAWVRVDPQQPCLQGSSDIDILSKRVNDDLRNGVSVALGFESPLFIPEPEHSSDLCKGRKNEGSRSFAAPVGLAVATLGLHEAAWILRRVANVCGPSVRFETKPSAWRSARDSAILFCWEAFVAGGAHSLEHVRDAATAAMAFVSAESGLAAATEITGEHPLSLIGAAALWSGLTADIAVLHEPTVVIRPEGPFLGDIPDI